MGHGYIGGTVFPRYSAKDRSSGLAVEQSSKTPREWSRRQCMPLLQRGGAGRAMTLTFTFLGPRLRVGAREIRVATVRKLLGRGEVKIVEGADHITTLTQPEFASAVIAFLRSIKPK